MADTAVAITAGAGTSIDTRTEGTNGNHRQVVVLGDPATNAGVAPVDATAGLKVDLGADNDVVVSDGGGAISVDDGGSTVSIDDGGGSITVDGSLTFSPSKAAVATLSNAADSNVSATLLAANANRLGMVIVNDSTVTLYVKYGTTASATSFTYLLQAGETLRDELYTGRVDGIWASDASGSARITELTAA